MSVESCKVVLIGESGVGKTSIISRFINDTFDPNTITSLGASFISKTITIEGKPIKFDIWDTAGQEKYRSLAKIFFKDAQIVIFVYDITNKKSFEEIKAYWYEQTKANSAIPNQIFAIASNKSDLYGNEQVDNKEGREYAAKIKAIFKETSALSSTGIDDLFRLVGKKYLNPDFDYLEEDRKLQEEYQQRQKGNVKLTNTDAPADSASKNCNC